jgi:hypothetical protein
MKQSFSAITYALNKIWRTFLRARVQVVEILSRAHRNFEKQNEALETSIIIINYCIILLLLL